MKTINRILCAVFGHSQPHYMWNEYRPTCRIRTWQCPKCGCTVREVRE